MRLSFIPAHECRGQTNRKREQSACAPVAGPACPWNEVKGVLAYLKGAGATHEVGMGCTPCWNHLGFKNLDRSLRQ